jgi:hypothetical protein
MKEKPSYYAIIPAEVRYSKKLTPNAKLLYAEITALCNMNGKCTASTEYFCRLYEVSRVSIQKWLKNLEENNYIKRVNIYLQGSKQIDTRVITLINTPCKEKFTDNTNINITNTNLTDSNKKAFFKKPTVEEVHQYCNERKNKVCADAFIDFYESKNFMIGKNKMKDWKACVRTWEMRAKNKKTNAPKSMSKLDAQINEWQKAKELL